MRKRLIGGLPVFAVLLAVGGCGGATDASIPQVVMFSDDFTDKSSGASWFELIYFHGFRGSSNRDTTIGNPRPSLALYNSCLPVPFTDPKLDQCDPTSAGVITGTSLALADGLSATVTVDAHLQPVTGAGTTPWAAVKFSSDQATDNYTICNPAAASCSSSIRAVSPDGGFHAYRFIVASDGSARWERDGVIQHSARVTLHGPFQVMLSAVAANVTGAKREYPVAHFDNVRVTRP